MESSVNQTAENLPQRISGWSELSKLVEHFSYFAGHAWLFRGTTDATHKLIPKIGRETARAEKLDAQTQRRARIPYHMLDERAVFAMFKQQARAHLSSPPQSDLEWLAIAQHFGLPTRLLDWTDSLLVAAWFAVEKGGAGGKDSAIWISKGARAIEMDHPGEVLNFAEPFSYRPPHINPRITAQGSVFVICPKPTEELGLPFIRKIVIDRSAHFTIKKRLNACGINRRHLFPDLAGLSDHLAWVYKHDWLAGYRADSTPSSASTEAPEETTE
jgi:hypothetical protein